MVKTRIIPSCIKYLNDITLTFNNLKLLNVNNNFLYQEIENISSLIELANEKYINLLNNVEKHKISNKYTYENAIIIKDNILSSMNELRSVIDKLETLINKKYWPIPSYKDMLIK
jgi:glutamine synthetase